MRKIIVAIGFAIMLAGLTAYANTTVDVYDYDRDTRIATVSGTTDRSEVTLSVGKGETVFYEGQQTAADGKYNFSFLLTGDDAADFSVAVSATKEAPISNTMSYYGNKVEETFVKLNEYAKAQDAASFKELFTNSLDILGMKLSAEEENAIDYMSNVLMLQAPYGKVSEMKTSFDTAKYLYDSATISDKKELNALIKSNKERFTKQYPNIYDVYENCDETKQEEICENIISAVNHNVVTEEGFNEIFAVQAMRVNIKSAEGWSAARDLVAKTKSEIRITASTLTNISDVYLGMINSDYNAIGDFERVYTEKLRDAERKQNQSSGSSSGGGSSSSKGGSSTFVPQPTVQPEKPAPKFGDIDGVKWAKTAIEELAKANVISGRDENTFDPDSPVLREEFIKMLVLAFDINIREDAAGFDDAAADSWFAKYANTAKYEGIVSGMGDNTFGAGQNITRQDMVTITYRAMEKYNITEKQDSENEETELFSDDGNIADYAHDGIYYLKNINVINGRESNRFDPQENISRAEAAKILYSVRNIKIEKDYVAEGDVQ